MSQLAITFVNESITSQSRQWVTWQSMSQLPVNLVNHQSISSMGYLAVNLVNESITSQSRQSPVNWQSISSMGQLLPVNLVNYQSILYTSQYPVNLVNDLSISSNIAMIIIVYDWETKSFSHLLMSIAFSV